MDGTKASGKNRPACLVCRSRKVKCDKKWPECQKCLNLGVKCPGYAGSASQNAQAIEDIYRDSHVVKRRVGSCHECRRMKLKCDQGRPECQRCQQRHQTCTYISFPAGTYDWLFDASLPQDPEKLSTLVTVFFDRIHPRRCLGFVHKPSFMHAMGQGRLVEEYGEPLVQIVCALGAYIYSRDVRNELVSSSTPTTMPGEAWATTARTHILADLATPNLKSAMALVLLSEYAAMTGQNAWAFLLVGSSFRVIRLLRLDSAETEATRSSDAVELESCRRMVWSCYLLDAQIGSGVDKHLNWRDDAPPIRLPCTEEGFTYGRFPANEETAVLSSLLDLPERHRVNVRANIIYVMWLRSQALRLNRVSKLDVGVWDEKSPFLELLQKLEVWYSSLPEQLRLTDLNNYVHKEQNSISAIYMLHFAYHSAVADLTRVSLPGFDFPLASLSHDAPPAFRKQCQERCRHHADEVSKLVEMGFAAGGRALDEPHCVSSAFEATKIQAVHTATLTRNGPAERARTCHQIAVNLRLISNAERFKNPQAKNYVSGLLLLLSKFGFKDAIPGGVAAPGGFEEDEEAEVVGPADSNHLSQVANFRQALSEVEARLKIQNQGHTPSASQLSGSTPCAVQPVITPVSTTLVPAPVGPLDARVPATGTAPTNDSTPVGAGVDYFRVADEMSNYMTWDFLELPPWIDFDRQDG